MFNYNDVLKKINKQKEESVNISDEFIVEKYKQGEFSIITEQARYPLANLRNIFSDTIEISANRSDNRYNLNPDYQRRRVWDPKRKSRLIESFIINVPIPPIFLYEVEYSSYEVMDGLQRVTTVIDFLDNKFELVDLEVWPELEGKTYEQLPREIKQSIDRRYLSSIILLKETARTKEEANIMKKFVFQRLNTGGVELSSQEVRNALYMSEFNESIVKWAENILFRELWGYIEDEDRKRMEDCELILRFFAYKSACKHNLTMTTVKMLDKYAEEGKIFKKKDIKVLENLLENTLKIVHHLFGENAFKSKENSKKSEKMIFDSTMIACAEFFEENKMDYQWIFEKQEGFLAQEKFTCIEENIDLFNGKYTSIKNVKERVQTIKGIIERSK